MSAKKAASAAPEAQVRLYQAAVAATSGAQLKGASMPYTSVNGNMYSFLDKHGVVAVRLGEPERLALRRAGGAPYVHETGAAMKEYVTMPSKILADSRRASTWLGTSLAYAKTLKPKATTRKKSA